MVICLLVTSQNTPFQLEVVRYTILKFVYVIDSGSRCYKTFLEEI